MKKVSIVLLFLIIYSSCVSSPQSGESLTYKSDGTRYTRGWKYVMGTDENYLVLPFYTQIKAKRYDTILVEIVGVEVIYFDNLLPEDVNLLTIGTIYGPGERIARYKR